MALRGSRTPRLLPHLETFTFIAASWYGYTMYIHPSVPSSLHPLRPAPDGGDAGARDFHKPERAHQVDELVDLGGIAGDLEHQALGRGVDHAGAERVGQPHRLDARLAKAAHFHHRQFALDRARAGQRHVDHLVDRDHAVELMLDLLDHQRRAGGDDSDAREVFLALRLEDGEAFDV